MRIVLFCEQKYAITILAPLQAEAGRSGQHDVLWFVDARNIPDFPLREEVNWTTVMQEVYDFSPDAIFVPGNIVPYYLPGVKAEIFHGYASEKKGHWIIRHYLDLYLTQGPYFTARFRRLAARYKDFEVVETGWTRQDWIHAHLHDFDREKEALLRAHGREEVVLYAPTFSPSLTSLPFLKEALERLVSEKSIVLLLKFHPLTRREWVEEYRLMASTREHVVWVDDHQLTKYLLMADAVISDTSSALYEALLLDKPVVTYGNTAGEKFWPDISDARALPAALDEARSGEYARKREWIIARYDPHRDGQVARRMLEAVSDYIKRHGVPGKRRLNPWRKYQCIKKFGRIRRGK
ncbi:MAG: CDP-glycerol glycerophosphotransferase family protein [Odoribacteraceae bacterium]|nr:CDP-glycerol glycerophosphotransferase family protein [Odoribacteraceae bacterium]